MSALTLSIVFSFVGNGFAGGAGGLQPPSANDTAPARISASAFTLVPEIIELQRQISNIFFNECHRGLQVVLFVARHANGRTLN